MKTEYVFNCRHSGGVIIGVGFVDGKPVMAKLEDDKPIKTLATFESNEAFMFVKNELFVGHSGAVGFGKATVRKSSKKKTSKKMKMNEGKRMTMCSEEMKKNETASGEQFSAKLIKRLIKSILSVVHLLQVTIQESEVIKNKDELKGILDVAYMAINRANERIRNDET